MNLSENFNVVIEGVVVNKVQKNPMSDRALRIVTKQLKEIFGQDYKIIDDIMSFTSYTYAKIKDFNILCYIMLLNYFAFHLDDYLDRNDNGEFKDIFLHLINLVMLAWRKWFAILKAQKCGGNGLDERLFNLLIEKSNKLMDGITSQKFYRSIGDWVQLCPEMQRIKSDQAKISDQELLDMRVIDSMLPAEFMIAQLDAKLNSESLEDDPNWIQFNRYSAYVVVIVNELYSLKKEARDGQAHFNYVFIKMKNNGLTAQQAVDELVRELRQYQQLMHRFGDNLRELGIKGTDAYVKRIIGYTDGNLYWSTICDRYNKLGIKQKPLKNVM